MIEDEKKVRQINLKLYLFFTVMASGCAAMAHYLLGHSYVFELVVSVQIIGLQFLGFWFFVRAAK